MVPIPVRMGTGFGGYRYGLDLKYRQVTHAIA